MSSIPPLAANTSGGSVTSNGLASGGGDFAPPDTVDFDVVIGACDEDGAVSVAYKFASVDEAIAYNRLIQARAIDAVVRTALAREHVGPSLPTQPAQPARPLGLEGRRRSGDSSSGKVAHPDYYDQNTSPLPKRRYLDLARRGAFPSSKIGKQVLAQRVDVDAFIASRAVLGRPSPSDPSGPPSDEMDEILGRAGLRRKP